MPTTETKFRGDGDVVIVDVAAGVGAQEVFTVCTLTAAKPDNGDHWTFSTPDHDYHVWYNTPGNDGSPQDPAFPFLAGLSSISIPVSFPASAAASSSAVAVATRDALNRLTGEVSASLVNNSTIQVAIKAFGSVTDAAAGTAGVTITIDTQGVDRSTIAVDSVVTGSAGNVNSVIDGTTLLDLEGSTYNLVEMNLFSIAGSNIVSSTGDTSVKTDNLVLSVDDLGGLGSTLGGVS